MVLPREAEERRHFDTMWKRVDVAVEDDLRYELKPPRTDVRGVTKALVAGVHLNEGE